MSTQLNREDLIEQLLNKADDYTDDEIMGGIYVSIKLPSDGESEDENEIGFSATTKSDSIGEVDYAFDKNKTVEEQYENLRGLATDAVDFYLSMHQKEISKVASLLGKRSAEVRKTKGHDSEYYRQLAKKRHAKPGAA